MNRASKYDVPRRAARLLLLVLVLSAAAVSVAAAAALAQPPLSRDQARASLASSYGSGSFGRWQVDAFGLPVYRYSANEQRDPAAHQPQLDGATRAQHQVGNDHIKGMAYNDGYTQFWSQDRLAQWANLYEPQLRHYAGGYGYLKLGSRTISTPYLDRPAHAHTERDFGVGYYHRRLDVDRVSIAENVYAPFGNDPVASCWADRFRISLGGRLGDHD